MGKRGFPAKPTALKVLQGNKRINKAEPKPPPAEKFEPPHALGKIARKAWSVLTEQLRPLGLLKNIDINELARYCDIYEKWNIAKAFLDKNGFSYYLFHEQTEEELDAGVDKRIKYVATYPETTIYMQLSKELTRIEQQFGMNPSARTSIKVEAPPAANPFQAFLNRGQKN